MIYFFEVFHEKVPLEIKVKKITSFLYTAKYIIELKKGVGEGKKEVVFIKNPLPFWMLVHSSFYPCFREYYYLIFLISFNLVSK